MKKLMSLLLLSLALCSCSFGLTEQEKAKMLTYDITSENYDLFFDVQHKSVYNKTVIAPNFNKHLLYENVVFSFKHDYTLYSSATGTYEYSVNVDETGNGQIRNIDTSSAVKSDKFELASVEGKVSFKDDYTTFKKIEKVKRDSLHQEHIGAYYSAGKSPYIIRFKADLNFDETADTDAFYLIESVEVKFTAIVNNATKNFEYVLYPNLYGIAEIPTDDYLTSISNFTFKYTNGYYLAY